MIGAYHLLDRLAAAGCHVALDGDHLDLDGPADVLTDDLAAELRGSKPAMLTLLRWRASAAAAGCDPAFLPLVGLTLGDICDLAEAGRTPRPDAGPTLTEGSRGCPRCGPRAALLLDLDDGARLCPQCGEEVAT